MLQTVLAFTKLRAKSVDDKFLIFFSFSPENRIWRFMQIVSTAELAQREVKVKKYLVCMFQDLMEMAVFVYDDNNVFFCLFM